MKRLQAFRYAHAIICIEDLKVANMSRSAKRTPDQPGTRVKQKTGLNRAILDQGWGEFVRQLGYKQEWRGGRLVVVEPHYTSQTCPGCSHVEAGNRRSHAIFQCLAWRVKDGQKGKRLSLTWPLRLAERANTSLR